MLLLTHNFNIWKNKTKKNQTKQTKTQSKTKPNQNLLPFPSNPTFSVSISCDGFFTWTCLCCCSFKTITYYINSVNLPKLSCVNCKLFRKGTSILFSHGDHGGLFTGKTILMIDVPWPRYTFFLFITFCSVFKSCSLHLSTYDLSRGI